MKKTLSLLLAAVFMLALLTPVFADFIRVEVTDYSFTIDSEGVFRLEAEEVDVTHHEISSSNPSKIVERADASGGKFLAAATGGVASSRYFEFSFTLDFNAHIVMSVAYAQTDKFKDRNEDMRNSYTYVFDGETTAKLTQDPILASRTDITKWDVKTYDVFALKAGTHAVKVSPLKDDGDGNPNIDYIEFDVIESDEDIEQNTISPANDIHTDLQYLYINDDYLNIHDYAEGTDASMSLPKAIVLNFSEDDIGTASEYIIQKSATADFADATTVTGLTTKSYKLYNVYLGEHFYWRAGTSLETIADSPVHEMTIASQGPRVLRVDGITNMRDIGGYDSYLVPGGKIRQGLYIRGANPDDITDLGKQQLYDLGIRQEIDMRDASHVVSDIPGVHYNNFPVSDGASEDARFDAYETSYKNIFELIANADLEPVYLHCYAGADRTGVASFILMAVCGASYEDCARDYLFTNFWKDGKRYISTVEKWVKKLNTQYEGYTLAEQARSWLLSKGVSSDTIEHIREIFVEGYVPYENVVVVSTPVAQLSADGASVRLIGAINSLNYKNAGFTVTVRDDINGKSSTITFADRKVYTSVVTGDKTLTSEDFGIENGYLCVLIITNLPDEFSLTASTAVTVYADPNYVYSGTAKRFRYETGTLHAAGENNLAVTATATDSGKEYYNENKKAQNAIDGDMNTDWQYATSAVLLTENSSTLTDCWLQVNFDDPVKVNTAIIKWETDTRCADGGYYLQYSLDGETFMDVPDSETVSGTTSTIYFTTVEAKYYRLVMTKGTSTKYAPKIYEFELHRD